MLQWQLIPLSAMDSNPHMQKLIIIVAALYTGQICSVASSLLECSRKLARHAALSLYTQPFASCGFLQMCQCYSWQKCIISGSPIWVSKMCIWRGLEPYGTMGCMHGLIVGLLCDWHHQARVSWFAIADVLSKSTICFSAYSGRVKLGFPRNIFHVRQEGSHLSVGPC